MGGPLRAFLVGVQETERQLDEKPGKRRKGDRERCGMPSSKFGRNACMGLKIWVGNVAPVSTIQVLVE